MNAPTTTEPTDFETVLGADPELVHALATLIRRARIHAPNGTLTLCIEQPLTEATDA